MYKFFGTAPDWFGKVLRVIAPDWFGKVLQHPIGLKKYYVL